MDRRLSTILAADIVGYSRMMGADEESTLRKLDALRKIRLAGPFVADELRNQIRARIQESKCSPVER